MGRRFEVNYSETTFGIRGGMITNTVDVKTHSVQEVLDTVNVACCGPSRKDKIIINIIEEINVQPKTDTGS